MLAIALVIIIIAITVVEGIGGSGSEAGKAEALVYWRSNARPFGIIDWGKANDTLYLSVINQGTSYIFLRQIIVGNVTADFGPGWAWRAGSAKNISIPGLPPCNMQDQSSFSYTITFVYDTLDIPNQRQQGEKQVMGECSF
jgi:hypothetical protein